MMLGFGLELSVELLFDRRYEAIDGLADLGLGAVGVSVGVERHLFVDGGDGE